MRTWETLEKTLEKTPFHKNKIKKLKIARKIVIEKCGKVTISQSSSQDFRKDDINFYHLDTILYQIIY